MATKKLSYALLASTLFVASIARPSDNLKDLKEARDLIDRCKRRYIVDWLWGSIQKEDLEEAAEEVSENLADASNLIDKYLNERKKDYRKFAVTEEYKTPDDVYHAFRSANEKCVGELPTHYDDYTKLSDYRKQYERCMENDVAQATFKDAKLMTLARNQVTLLSAIYQEEEAKRADEYQTMSYGAAAWNAISPKKFPMPRPEVQEFARDQKAA